LLQPHVELVNAGEGALAGAEAAARDYEVFRQAALLLLSALEATQGDSFADALVVLEHARACDAPLRARQPAQSLLLAITLFGRLASVLLFQQLCEAAFGPRGLAPVPVAEWCRRAAVLNRFTLIGALDSSLRGSMAHAWLTRLETASDVSMGARSAGSDFC
jgi:hypothetical protein